jgi:hypothetical protein
MRRALLSCLILWSSLSALNAQQQSPVSQVIRTRYEAVDPRAGGHFTIWLDRETVRLGINNRLYPAVSYVEITHLTPTVGSPPITFIEVMTVNSTEPEFYHIGGVVRVKISGMKVTASNLPKVQ